MVVDLQRAFEREETLVLARDVAEAIAHQPGKTYALVQVNPPDGPLRTLREWCGAADPGDGDLLRPLHGLDTEVFAKRGYGADSPLPLDVLRTFDVVYVVGADTDACVLATSLALFDAGVQVVVREDLCWSSGGQVMHEAGLQVLRRQLGRDRVLRPSR